MGNGLDVLHWKLPDVDTPHGARSPVVLHSKDGAERAVLIELRAGEALGEHSVKESALLLVLDGAARVEGGGEAVDGTTGSLFHFDPDERHSITSETGARLLLVLSPWTGEGHYRGEQPAASGVSAS